jgi:hypothetical protein
MMTILLLIAVGILAVQWLARVGSAPKVRRQDFAENDSPFRK